MKKSVWRLLLVGLILLLSMGLIVGCGGGDTSSESAEGEGEAVQEEEKVVNLLSWGGTIQQTFEEEGFAQKFKDATGYEFVLTPKGTSSEIMAAALAQKDNPQIDVVMCDVGPFITGDQQGIFITPDAANIPNMNDLYESAFVGNGIQPYTSAGVIIYNPEYFAAQGWEPPTSWADLSRPEFKGKLAIPPPSQTFGLFALVELAKLGGGSETNIEPGFEMLKEIAPRVVEWPGTYSKTGELMQSEAAVIAVTEYVAGMDLKRKGLNVEIVLPKEGSFASPVVAGIMKGCKHPKGAELLVNFLISPEFLKYQGEQFGKGSYNKTVVLDADKAPYSLTGEEKMSKLNNLNWEAVNLARDQWVEKFEKEIAPLTNTAK
jgi:putative spermidine/putrescine transport system substrate-binding protein